MPKRTLLSGEEKGALRCKSAKRCLNTSEGY